MSEPKSIVKRAGNGKPGNPPSSILHPQQELPLLFTPTITVPGARPGEWIVRAGKPIVLSEEISVAQASQILGLSRRRIADMCDQGIFVEGRDWNRPGSSNRGKYFLKKAAVLARKGLGEGEL